MSSYKASTQRLAYYRALSVQNVVTAKTVPLPTQTITQACISSRVHLTLKTILQVDTSVPLMHIYLYIYILGSHNWIWHQRLDKQLMCALNDDAEAQNCSRSKTNPCEILCSLSSRCCCHSSSCYGNWRQQNATLAPQKATTSRPCHRTDRYEHSLYLWRFITLNTKDKFNPQTSPNCTHNISPVHRRPANWNPRNALT